MKKLIIGLGNPGEQYERTRHNVGFCVVDKVCEILNISLTNNKFDGLFYVGNDFIVGKPMTYMNLSGNFVKSIVDFYKIQPEDILIIYDDLDTPLGQAKIKTKGGSGGHNGLKNIIEKLNTENINRLKIGIDRPSKDSNITIANYVLGKFPKKDEKLVNLVMEEAAKAVINTIDNGIKNVINNFNKPKSSKG